MGHHLTVGMLNPPPPPPYPIKQDQMREQLAKKLLPFILITFRVEDPTKVLSPKYQYSKWLVLLEVINIV